MKPKRESIWALQDLVESPDVGRLDEDRLREILDTLKNHRIERYERPSPKPGVPENYGASPKQLKTQEVFFENVVKKGQIRIVAASGANQSGKTQCIGGMCFAKFIRDHARDGDVFWVIAQSHDSMRDIPQKTLWEFLPRSMFPDGVEYTPRMGFGQIPTLHLKLPDRPGKCELWFKTEQMDIVAFESSRLKGAWWTECKRQAIFGAIQPRLAANRGFLLMDYVPTEGWHKYQVQSGESPYIYHTRFCMKDNAHNLPPGEIEYQRSNMSEEEAAVRIDGEDAAAFGVVFKQFKNRHKVDPFYIPPEFPRWRCMDHGYRAPTACLWVAMLPVGWELPSGEVTQFESAYVYRELYVTEMTVQQIVERIHAMSGDEQYQGQVIVDPTIFNITQANGTSIAQSFLTAGLAVRPGIRVQKYGGMAMVENVRRWFENDRLYFSTDCKNAIREHEIWKYKETRDGQAPPDEPFEKRNDHTCDALKLLLAEQPRFASSMQGEPVDIPVTWEV